MKKVETNNSKFTFNQKLTVEHNPEQPVFIIYSVDWNFIKEKLVNKTSYWFILDRISNILLGVGIGSLFDKGWNYLNAWLVMLTSIIGILITYIFKEKDAKYKCNEVIELMNLAEKRHGIGQEDKTTNIKPNITTSNKTIDNS